MAASANAEDYRSQGPGLTSDEMEEKERKRERKEDVD